MIRNQGQPRSCWDRQMACQGFGLSGCNMFMHCPSIILMTGLTCRNACVSDILEERLSRISLAEVTSTPWHRELEESIAQKSHWNNKIPMAHRLSGNGSMCQKWSKHCARWGINIFSIYVFIGHMKESPWHRTSKDFHFLSGTNTNPQVLVTGTIIMPTVLNHESHWHTVFHIPLKLIVTDVERPCRTSFSSSFLSVAMRLCVRVKRCA